MSDYTHQPLEYDRYFHIYNRGINKTELFINQQNHELFLRKYEEYIQPVSETYAWCLMGNHFHLLVKILREDEIQFIKPKKKSKKVFNEPKKYDPTKQFSHLFDSYAKNFNFQNNRSGGLFETPFRRVMIKDDNYLKQVVYYIHFNPVKHGFVKNISDYKWSSYLSLVSDKSTNIQRGKVLEWFNSKQGFIEYHKHKLSEDNFGQFDLDDVS